MRTVDLAALAAAFSPGERVFLPGAGGEHKGFTAALTAEPRLTRGLELTTSFAPGINRLPTDRLGPDARVRALFPWKSDNLGDRLQALPVSYAGFVRDLQRGPGFDAVVVHVAPPDAEGRYSLGVAAEFTPLVVARSRRVLAVLNPNMPAIANAPSIALDRIDLAAEAEAELATYAPGAPDAAAVAIAHHVARFVPDGATLQLGLGKAPAAIAAALTGHRRLRFWSGMVSDSLLELAEAGALADNAPHVACAAVGSAGFYQALAGRVDIRIAGCEVTHDAGRLAALPSFVAVNSALEVDLYGQCNLEAAGGGAVSGAGGAPDFARVASKGSAASIVALPSTAGREGRSRIVARLDGGLVTLARHEVDVVVTEHGAADLRGLDVEARAAALITVAAPAVRDNLARAWCERSRSPQGAPA